MRCGSCFAGIGGFDLALERAGWECAWQIEKDPACREVLSRHFPGVPQFGDITEVDPREFGPVDLVCGGFPCQDLSVAGNRAGLAGARSGLFWEMHRLVARLRPRWVVYENVPGLLSSNDGRDFGAILGAVGQLGYGYAYRVLDAQHFGVPQRRRRVFIVGCLGDGRAAAQVLLEPEGGAGGTPAGREARLDLAQAVRTSTGSRGTDDPDPLMRSGGPGQSGFQRELNGLIADPLRSMTEEADVASTRRGHSPTQSEVVVAGVHANQRGEARISERAGSLNGSRSGKQYEGVMVGTGAQAVGLHLTQTPVSGDVSPATGESSRIGVGRGATVRRLTPTECERLQGFPDGWTSGQPDSRRYSQLGNAVAVPVVQWIVKRLDATQKEEE